MIKIIVFGATGGTGSEVVKQGLEKGYEINAVVRNPESLHASGEHLKIIKGDLLDVLTFEKEMDDKTAVISCVGSGSNETKVYSEGIKNIISAMNKSGAKRLICVSSATADNEKSFVMHTMMKQSERIFSGLYKDMHLMESIVEKTDLDWTIMKPPMLTNKSFTGKYQVAVGEELHHPWSISRADLADFMLNNITNADTFKKRVELAN